MSGRKENDQKNIQWIHDKLTSKPDELRSYMNHIARNKTTMTQRAYLGYLLQYLEYCSNNNLDFLKVKPMNLDSYINYLSDQGNGNKIINTKLAALISFYGFLQTNELIDKNPCSKIEKLKVEGKSQVISMSDEEVNKVKINIATTSCRRSHKYKNRDYAIVTLGCATGLRISEILNIDIDDIDFENNTIQVIVKGGKSRIIYFGENTRNALETWIYDRDKILGNSNEKALFINPQHHRLKSGSVRDMLNKETAMLDKHITPHKMRSTCAMKLYEKKGDIYLVAQQLGHANIRNTMIYAEATEEKRREAASILD